MPGIAPIAEMQIAQVQPEPSAPSELLRADKLSGKLRELGIDPDQL